MSQLIPSPVNGYLTFLVAPDGRKEGWRESVTGDAARDAFVAYLQATDDGCESITWIEASYGDDEDSEPTVGRHSRMAR